MLLRKLRFTDKEIKRMPEARAVGYLEAYAELNDPASRKKGAGKTYKVKKKKKRRKRR